jgi:uncharacterized membrane protein
MEPQYRSGTGSTAAIRGHPIHPILVTAPIGMMIGALAGDIAFYYSRDPFWAQFAYWLLLGTLVTGAAAALPGIVDFMSFQRARTMGIAWAHAIGNVLALAIVLVNFRSRIDAPEDPAMPYGLIFSVATIVLFALTGWLGGEMSFRHGLGVSRGIGLGTDKGNEDVTPAGRADIGKS